MTDPMQEFQEARDQVVDVETDASGQVRRALFLWAFRWAIGFGLIWAVTAWTGRFGWLWTAGLILAALSLILTLAFRILILRKAQAAQMKLDDLTRLLEQQERNGGPSPQRPDTLDTSQGTDPEIPNGKL